MGKKRILVYLLCVVAIFFSIVIKQNVIKRKRNKEIISAYSEWQKNGKPVVVRIAKKKDVPSYTKVTAWQKSPRIFEGHVSKAVRGQLQIGQEMLFKVNDLTYQGTISEISDKISFDTGMFPVYVEFQETFDISGWRVAYAHTGTIRNAINIPNGIIERVDNEFLVWKIEGGHAVKQPITIKQRNGYGAIVGSGIQDGDKLVFEGFTQLREGDKVNILKEYIEGKRHD